MDVNPIRLAAALLAAALLPTHALAAACPLVQASHDDDEDGEALRAAAAREVLEGRRGRPDDEVAIQILALNDFHGQLEPGRTVSRRPVGSAAVLAAWLEQARAGREDVTYVVHAGDHVGASPPASALLKDEPGVSFFNLFANEKCKRTSDEEGSFEAWLHPRCNVVATVGNHEFDEGREELLRLLGGGDHPLGPFLEALMWTKELLEVEGYDVRVHQRAFGVTEKVMLDPPDLVLVDVNMPALSGEGLVAVLRGREQTRDVPVLLHSSNDEAALAEASRRLGIAGFVAKGDPEQLRRKVAAAVKARTGPA